jgi:predicted ATPase
MSEAARDHSGYGLMIESVEFRNFKVLRNAKLPLGWFTLLVGANSSGKTTAIQGLETLSAPQPLVPSRFSTAGSAAEKIEMIVRWRTESAGMVILEEPLSMTARWYEDRTDVVFEGGAGQELPEREPRVQAARNKLRRIRAYSLDAGAIAAPARLDPRAELQRNGGNFAGMLDRMRDHSPERFEALREELEKCLPEFDRIGFEMPEPGVKRVQLRTRRGKHMIGAPDLSQGTLIALAVLTLAYLPDPPAMVCLEEVDRGIHPRLLRRIRDALYRLSYPQKLGDSREPVQVLATTHSPYFLDLFREHPEEIVIAQRVGDDAIFEPLAERRNIAEILEGTHLGEAWYSGNLGGVPPEE